MRFSHRAFLLLLAAAMLAAGSAKHAALAQADAFEWDDVDKVVAFADVHGADRELRTLLRDSGVIDDR